jgi:hypothetical protein
VNQKGTSLIEVIIASGIGVGVCLATSALLIFSVNQYNAAANRTLAEEQLLMAQYYLRLYISNAVGALTSDTRGNQNLNCWDPGQLLAAGSIPTPDAAFTYPGGGLNNIIAQGNGGIFASCYMGGASDSTVNTNQIDPIGVFIREQGPDQTGNSFFKLSALSYQRPVFNADPTLTNRPGRLIFTTSQAAVANNPPGFIPGIIFAGPGDVSIDQLVYFGIQFDNLRNPVAAYPNLLVAKSATITIVIRYFTEPDKNLWQWCMMPPNPPTTNLPSATGGGNVCSVNTVPHNDLTATIQIGFRDNVLSNGMTNGNTTDQRLFGSLYFFQQTMPKSVGF